ncbi:MAG: SDR family oxidoreductase, partial [Phyllobacteriaceae bacterium]|nr:SDR family oxidoreductase [Phyllobacteriaceae bacterium]
DKLAWLHGLKASPEMIGRIVAGNAAEAFGQLPPAMQAVAQEAARRWVAGRRAGAIVAVASILGVRVAGGVAPYAASKAGLIQLTKAMALELARHDIRVNALLPGWFVTDLNRDFLESEAGDRLRRRVPMRRFGRPEDLDGPLLLLASDAGRGMTGTTVTVDHGHTISAL